MVFGNVPFRILFVTLGPKVPVVWKSKFQQYKFMYTSPTGKCEQNFRMVSCQASIIIHSLGFFVIDAELSNYNDKIRLTVHV